MWDGLADGSIDVVASDHVPRKRATKEKPIWQASQGFPGTATILPVLLDRGYHRGRLSLGRIAELLCAAPAAIFGLPAKGRIQIGADADLTLADLNRERIVRAENSVPIPITAFMTAGLEGLAYIDHGSRRDRYARWRHYRTAGPWALSISQSRYYQPRRNRMIDLYAWPTPNAYKVSIMLEETGLAYNVIPVNIGAGEQFAPEFLKISPNNRMPAIVDHGRTG